MCYEDSNQRRTHSIGRRIWRGRLSQREHRVSKDRAAVDSAAQSEGHTVIDATVDRASTQLDYLQKSVQIANKARADMFLTIHLNAGGGQGCEAYTWKGEKVEQAVNMCKQLAAEGFKNRGVKDGSAFYVIKKTQMTAILLEVFFLDNRKDCQRYQRIGVKRIAQAIADGIS